MENVVQVGVIIGMVATWVSVMVLYSMINDSINNLEESQFRLYETSFSS